MYDPNSIARAPIDMILGLLFLPNTQVAIVTLLDKWWAKWWGTGQKIKNFKKCIDKIKMRSFLCANAINYFYTLHSISFTLHINYYFKFFQLLFGPNNYFEKWIFLKLTWELAVKNKEKQKQNPVKKYPPPLFFSEDQFYKIYLNTNPRIEDIIESSS